MDAAKKEIRKACKIATDYRAWRNVVGVWTVTLFDKEGNSFLEFQYADYFSKRDKDWVAGLLEKIDIKKRK